MDDELRAYERRFRRAGLPLFIEDFRASTNVFNRAAPVLAISFVAQMLNAANLDWSPLANVAAVVGGLVILVLAVGIANRARERPFLSIPRTVGKVELALYVLVPALLPLVFGGQEGVASLVVLANLLFLALIYAVLGLGLFAILRWVLARLLSQLAGSLELIARAVPLLAIFALLSFTTQEMWEIFASLPTPIFWTIIGLFVFLGTAFLVVRLPKEARALEREAKADDVPLRRRQRLNVGLVMFVSQAVQVLIVSLVVAAFFALFGLLAIDETVRTDWIGSGGDVLFSFDLFGTRLELTRELLRVAIGLGAFSGFYFAIAMLTDSTYREEFLEELSSEMRASFEARAEYLRLRAA
ncbi:MAG TPA: hypothetical protein VFY99_04400 [Solirubrobacterales bacterium]